MYKKAFITSLCLIGLSLNLHGMNKTEEPDNAICVETYGYNNIIDFKSQIDNNTYHVDVFFTQDNKQNGNKKIVSQTFVFEEAYKRGKFLPLFKFYLEDLVFEALKKQNLKEAHNILNNETFLGRFYKFVAEQKLSLSQYNLPYGFTYSQEGKDFEYGSFNVKHIFENSSTKLICNITLDYNDEYTVEFSLTQNQKALTLSKVSISSSNEEHEISESLLKSFFKTNLKLLAVRGLCDLKNIHRVLSGDNILKQFANITEEKVFS